MKKYMFLSLKMLISAGLIYWLLSKVDVKTTGVLIHSLNPYALLIPALLLLAQLFSCILRWYYLLPIFNINQPFRDSIQTYWISAFFNNCLPSGVAGDALRIQLMRTPSLSIPQLISVTFLDRLIGLLVLLLLVAISMMAYKPILASNSLGYFFIILVLGGFLAVGALSILHRIPLPWDRFLALKMVKILSLDIKTFWAARAKIIPVLSVSLMNIVAQVLAVFFLARGLHLPVSLLQCAILTPPVILAMLMPVSIGGWGIREGAMITLFGLIGVSTTAAFSLSILFGSLALLINLPGGFIWVLWRKKNEKLPIVETI